MNIKQIEKCLKLYNNGELIELKKELELALIEQTQPKTKFNLIKAVERFLKNTDNSRPVLKTILEQPNDTQSIIDGYCGVVFEKPFEELKSLPYTPKNTNGLNIEQVFYRNNATEITPTAEELNLLGNLKKYSTLAKGTELDNKKEIFIKLFDRVFNTNLLLKVLSVLGELEDLKFYTESEQVGIKPLFFYNTKLKIKGIILPIRILSEEEKTKIEEQQNEIMKRFKGE